MLDPSHVATTKTQRHEGITKPTQLSIGEAWPDGRLTSVRRKCRIEVTEGQAGSPPPQPAHGCVRVRPGSQGEIGTDRSQTRVGRSALCALATIAAVAGAGTLPALQACVGRRSATTKSDNHQSTRRKLHCDGLRISLRCNPAMDAMAICGISVICGQTAMLRWNLCLSV